MAKRTWKSRFKPGDVVKFTGPWKFDGNVWDKSTFSMDVEYTVMDASSFEDQLETMSTPHALISDKHPTGSPDGHGRWVDETCIEPAYTEPTEEEIAALFGIKPSATESSDDQAAQA